VARYIQVRVLLSYTDRVRYNFDREKVNKLDVKYSRLLSVPGVPLRNLRP